MNISKPLAVQRIIFGILTVVCMVMIFRFSMEDADTSSDTSGAITETAVDIFVSDYEELPPAEQSTIMSKADHIVRKCAHYSIYTLLGFLASLTVGRRKLLSKGSIGALCFCFLYACSDEIHQHFVPGRACAFTDVLIDTGGALTGILISMLIMLIVHKLISLRAAKKAQ